MSSYDEVLYPSHAFPETHPDRLATIGKLLGLNPNRGKCRVLDVGCGDGSNLIPMGISLPHADLVGFDLAKHPIEAGKKLVSQLGLRNVDLRVMNLLEFPPDFGEFDYIIAHGFCSWVPACVLEKFFAVCRDHLTRDGIVFASYNTFPEGHLRQVTRDVMKFRMSSESGTIAGAKEYLKELVESTTNEHWKSILKSEAERLAHRDENVLFHDDLGEIYRPFLFTEFIELAERFDLQFLCESKIGDAIQPSGPAKAVEMARRLANGDEVAFQQHLDFAVCRGFRKTLLCRSNLSVDRKSISRRVPDLLVASSLRWRGSDAQGVATFQVERGSERIQTDDPVLVEVLKNLERVWPRGLPIAGLVPSNLSPERLSKFSDNLLGLAAVALVDFRAFDLPVASAPTWMPVASSLARIQASQGPLLSSVLHSHVEVKDHSARMFLASLDGTRTQDDIAASIAMQNGQVPLEQASRFVSETLTGLYRLGLMVG